MSSLRDAAFPRGRPNVDAPTILPLTGRALPAAVWERGLLYLIGGHPVQWVSERWRKTDAWACPTPTLPDPERPGYCVSIRMVDWSAGEIIPPADCRTFESAARLLESFDIRRVALGGAPTYHSAEGKPLQAWEFAYEIAGSAYMFVGERWRRGEEWAALSPCIPDTQNPEIMLTIRLLGPDGEPISPVSSGEFASAPLLPPSAPARPSLRRAGL